MKIGDLHKKENRSNQQTLCDLKKYAKTLEFERLLKQSLDVMDTYLNKARNPVISCGGGKDGTAALLLSKLVGADVKVLCANPPNPLPDREKHIENLKHWAGNEWIDIAYDWDVQGVLCGREPYPDGLKMKVLSEYQKDNDIDGVVFGIRAAESNSRRINLAMRGEIYETENGTRCQPIARWRAEHSLCLALLMDAPINPVYIKMNGTGGMEQLHDGTWWPHGLQDGSGWIKKYYPEYAEVYEQALKIGASSDECIY